MSFQSGVIAFLLNNASWIGRDALSRGKSENPFINWCCEESNQVVNSGRPKAIQALGHHQ